MFAVLALVGALAADTVVTDVAPVVRRAPWSVGAVVGLGLVSEPALDVHVGVFARSRFSQTFLLRTDVSVDVGDGNRVVIADAASQYVHDVSDAVELAIGGGPAGGVFVRSDDDSNALRVDGVAGIVGITTAAVAVASWWSLGLELRGLVAVVVPSAELLVAPSLSVTTVFKF